MGSLVDVALKSRRAVRHGAGGLMAASFLALVATGTFAAPRGMSVEHVVVAVAWLVIFVARVRARSRRADARERARLDVELGVFALAGVYAAVQRGGGLASDVYAAVYVVVAFLAAFATKPAGLVLVGVALAYEAVLHFVTEGRADARGYLLHAAFLSLFGLLHLLFTRAEIARVRELSKKELDDEKRRVRDDARLYRLVAPAGSDSRDEERLYRSSVEEVKNHVFHVLDLVRKALDLHTVVLLLVDGERLRIAEASSLSDDLADGPFSSGSGVVGAIVKRREPIALENLKEDYRGLCYYRGAAQVKAFIGIPVLEGDELRGVLCADRQRAAAFDDRDEDILHATVVEVLRATRNERLFVQLERSKREQGLLYRASQALGAALDEDAVLDAALGAAREIAEYDYAAVTLYDAPGKRHFVRKAIGDGADEFQSLTFADNASLTAMVVKNRHYLPYRGDFEETQQALYTKRANLRGMASLLVLPLLVREDAVGTLALASRRKDAFGDSVRATLEVLSNQLAVAIANAHAVKRLEEMATTDGLTGCLNKRAFLEQLEAKLRSAQRFERPLALIVTDIDHFKSVNDTYGHATGDVVIKALGEILRRMKRDTDLVARFGGEEFCVLCEETDADGAALLAERIRVELGETPFQTELGKLSVTCSLGVATFPRDASDAKALFEASDRALYAAKHGGRNLVCRADTRGRAETVARADTADRAEASVKSEAKLPSSTGERAAPTKIRSPREPAARAATRPAPTRPRASENGGTRAPSSSGARPSATANGRVAAK